MSVTQLSTPRSNRDLDDQADKGGPRLIASRRRSLPGSRSVVGGLLVLVAVLLAWWAASGGDQPSGQPIVVAATPIAPGQVIRADQLATITADLPAPVASRTFTESSAVAGRVALGPLAPGTVIGSGSVSDSDPPRGEREITFPVQSAWALDGRLRPGDRIDVFATYGDGSTSQTMKVLAGVTVREFSVDDTRQIGDGSGTTLTVAVGPSVSMESVVNASRAAVITVARVTTTAEGTSHDTTEGHYRAAEDLSTGSSQPSETPASGRQGP